MNNSFLGQIIRLMNYDKKHIIPDIEEDNGKEEQEMLIREANIKEEQEMLIREANIYGEEESHFDLDTNIDMEGDMEESYVYKENQTNSN